MSSVTTSTTVCPPADQPLTETLGREHPDGRRALRAARRRAAAAAITAP